MVKEFAKAKRNTFHQKAMIAFIETDKQLKNGIDRVTAGDPQGLGQIVDGLQQLTPISNSDLVTSYKKALQNHREKEWLYEYTDMMMSYWLNADGLFKEEILQALESRRANSMPSLKQALYYNSDGELDQQKIARWQAILIASLLRKTREIIRENLSSELYASGGRLYQQLITETFGQHSDNPQALSIVKQQVMNSCLSAFDQYDLTEDPMVARDPFNDCNSSSMSKKSLNKETVTLAEWQNYQQQKKNNAPQLKQLTLTTLQTYHQQKYQALIAEAKDFNNTGAGLIAAGIGLIGLGTALIPLGVSAIPGLAIIGAGVGLVTIGCVGMAASRSLETKASLHRVSTQPAATRIKKSSSQLMQNRLSNQPETRVNDSSFQVIEDSYTSSIQSSSPNSSAAPAAAKPTWRQWFSSGFGLFKSASKQQPLQNQSSCDNDTSYDSDINDDSDASTYSTH